MVELYKLINYDTKRSQDDFCNITLFKELTNKAMPTAGCAYAIPCPEIPFVVLTIFQEKAEEKIFSF